MDFLAGRAHPGRFELTTSVFEEVSELAKSLI
jgi:hypothetical protein